jgi:hypothetical protein
MSTGMVPDADAQPQLPCSARDSALVERCRPEATPVRLASAVCSLIWQWVAECIWAVGRIREHPAYAQIHDRVHEISELKAQF